MPTLSSRSLCLSFVSASSWKRCRSSQIAWLPLRGDGNVWNQRWAMWVGLVRLPYIAFLRAWSRQPKLEPKRVSPLKVLALSELKDAGETTSPHIIKDPYDDIFGLEHYPKSRRKVGLWCGSDSQYVKQFPCSNCRGRGYIRCEECDITCPKGGCPLCAGKGFRTCPECLGERVVLEQTLNESSWDTTNTISLLKVPDDEGIENMEIPITIRKTKRVYGPQSSETREKIRKSLKEFEQRTGLISRRMKNLHKDPVVLARRIAAIKKAKSTPEARRWMSDKQKQYFSDPENRRKRSIRMKGIKFFCRNCGGEGHKKNSCPKSSATETSLHVPRSYHCRLCLQPGHQSRTCPGNPVSKLIKSSQKTSTPSAVTNVKTSQRRAYKCSRCCQLGHSIRTCPKCSELSSVHKEH